MSPKPASRRPPHRRSVGSRRGTRTVSVAWLNRIADALGVRAADLVTLPDRADIAVAALLDASGAHAPKRLATIIPPSAETDHIAVSVHAGVGDYRAGDQIWCRRISPDRFTRALNRDVLVPRPAGRFLFGRLIGREDGKLHLLPLGPGARQQVVADPPWIAMVSTLVRSL